MTFYHNLSDVALIARDEKDNDLLSYNTNENDTSFENFISNLSDFYYIAAYPKTFHFFWKDDVVSLSNDLETYFDNVPDTRYTKEFCGNYHTFSHLRKKSPSEILISII